MNESDPLICHGVTSSVKCVNACSNGGERFARAGGISRPRHRPPATTTARPRCPVDGRFTSSTSPAEITTSIAILRRLRAARRLRPGSSSMRCSFARDAIDARRGRRRSAGCARGTPWRPGPSGPACRPRWRAPAGALRAASHSRASTALRRRIARDARVARDHALHVAVEDRAALAAREGRDRRRRGAARRRAASSSASNASGKRPPNRATTSSRSAVQVAGARVVAQPAPEREHVAPRRPRRGGARRESARGSARSRGCTVATCVCCSMTSESQRR